MMDGREGRRERERKGGREGTEGRKDGMPTICERFSSLPVFLCAHQLQNNYTNAYLPPKINIHSRTSLSNGSIPMIAIVTKFTLYGKLMKGMAFRIVISTKVTFKTSLK